MVTLITQTMPSVGRVHSIPTERISSRGKECRFDFNDEALLSLADSIRRHGILTPLTVRKREEAFEVISGERRLRAALILGIDTLPCFVAEGGAEIALIENMQRENLNMFEQAALIENLIREKALTQEETARILSCSQSAVANKLRLLRFEPDERRLIVSGALTERHARAFLRISDKKERLSAICRVIDEDMNVSSCEALVEELVGDKTRLAALRGRYTPVCSVSDPEFFFNTIKKVADDLCRIGLDVVAVRGETDNGVCVTVTLKKK